MKETDIVRLGQNLIDAGKALIDNGSRALAVTASWQHGPGGTTDAERVTHSRSAPTPTIPKEGRDLIGVNAELKTLLKRMYADEYRLRTILSEAVPEGTRKPTNAQKTPAQAAVEGWCRSCFRDHGYLEPIAIRPDGTRRYRDFCNYCGTFKNEYGIEPPMKILRMHLEGRRVSVRDVEAAIRETTEKTKKGKVA